MSGPSDRTTTAPFPDGFLGWLWGLFARRVGAVSEFSLTVPVCTTHPLTFMVVWVEQALLT